MQNFNILELIPQRPPIVMVDKLSFCDETKTISHFIINPDNIFCDKDIFLEAGLIENIAQTAAARMGYLSKINGKEILVGYIGAIKNLTVYFQPPVLTKLTTEVDVVSEIIGFTLITGKITANDKMVAECEMRIFLLQ